MRPLLFVNWSSVSARFTALMWGVVLVLTVVVLTHLPTSSAAPASPVAHIAPAANR